MSITDQVFHSTDLLNKAGDVAALSFRPSDEGFMVNTTWRLIVTLTISNKH
jgi:hypothetical protein